MLLFTESNSLSHAQTVPAINNIMCAGKKSLRPWPAFSGRRIAKRPTLQYLILGSFMNMYFVIILSADNQDQNDPSIP